jgi:tetratricopeptide (TPR) repeat protein
MEKTTLRFKRTPVLVCCIALLFLAGGGRVNAAASGNGGYAAPYFQADFIQTLSDWSSPLVNPALLYRVNQKHFDIGFYQYAVFEQGLGYRQAQLLWPILRNHTVGLTVLWSGSDIESRLFDQLGNLPSTPTSASFGDYWIIGNYGVRVMPWLMLGANLKLRYEKQFSTSGKISSMPGLDIGVYVNPLDNYRDMIGDLGISLAVQDIIPTKVDWTSDVYQNGVQLPSESNPELVANRARFGVRWAGFNDNVVADGELVIDNALISVFKSFDSYKNMFQAKDSLNNIVGELLAAYRGGFHVKAMFVPQVWFKAGWTNNNIPYVGFNYNLIYLLPEMINYVNFDCNFGYSFMDRSSDSKDERGFTMMTKIGTDFGQTREQILSKRLYDQLIVAPMDAYNEAMRLYLAGKYLEATWAFGKVLSLFPNFHLNDKAKFYLGDCYTKLYLHDVAREVFKQALEEFTTSDMRSKYIYGLERLDYREGKYDDALKNHAFIINLYPESEIRADADYLAGEIQFQRKNYNVAEQLFAKIKPTDPAYLYAQYTQAIINIENNKEQAALQNLMTIVKDSTQQAPDQMLQDAANLKLGHLYFESGDKLRQAVEAYSRVTEGSPYQDEALLGTAWAWMKVNRPQEAQQTTDKLIFTCKESPLIPEAYMVKGYSLMLQKQCGEAVPTLEACLNACKKTFVTQEDLQKHKAEFDDQTQKFGPTAEKMLKNSGRKPTNKTIEERPELEKEFGKFSKQSRDFFDYTLVAQSHTRFFKRKEDVTKDAEYALAKATNCLKAKGAVEDMKDSKEKAEKIQKELEKTKKELENLQKGSDKGNDTGAVKVKSEKGGTK